MCALRAHPAATAAAALAAALLPALAAPPAPAAELPEAGSARYWIQEGGARRGYEILRWEYPEDGTFRLVRIRQERQRPIAGDYQGVRRIRRIREISEGTLEGDRAQPQTYERRTATVFPSADDYDPETAFEGVEEEVQLRVRFTEDEAALEQGEVAAPPSALDPVSHRWQVMQQALEGERFERISHQVVNRQGEVEEIAFRIEGRRTVHTPAGTFRAVRLRRHQPERQRSVRWYMAEGWAGLPVRTVTVRSAAHAERTRLQRIEAQAQAEEG
ncbi:DUF3108 domain-containing protein [Halorhodospira neutriphila]|uniref:DUF3108 domain-containing protein n=1 Tax=Halorhodospira neutriphila TaxID=168379 RepID=A0ABS1E6I3_9GAMM|nr:DUF3108 domain-containing protein [Halorhodospira neutriphila]MBK1726812.1 hypothetical protein [Halorhodospira neutriphila]